MYKQANPTPTVDSNDANNPLPAALMLGAIGGVAGLGGSLLSKKQRKHKLRNTLLGATALPAAFLAANKWGPEAVKGKLNDFSGNVYDQYAKHIQGKLPESMANYIGNKTYNTKDYTKDINEQVEKQKSNAKAVADIQTDKIPDKNTYNQAVNNAQQEKKRIEDEKMPDDYQGYQGVYKNLETERKNLEELKKTQETTRQQDALKRFHEKAKNLTGEEKDLYDDYLASLDDASVARNTNEQQLADMRKNLKQYDTNLKNWEAEQDKKKTARSEAQTKRQAALDWYDKRIAEAEAKKLKPGWFVNSPEYNEAIQNILSGNERYQNYLDLLSTDNPEEFLQKSKEYGLGGDSVAALDKVNTLLADYDKHNSEYFEPYNQAGGFSDAFEKYISDLQDQKKSEYISTMRNSRDADIRNEIREIATKNNVNRSKALEIMWEEAIKDPEFLKLQLKGSKEDIAKNLIQEHKQRQTENKDLVAQRNKVLQAIKVFIKTRNKQFEQDAAKDIETVTNDASNMVKNLSAKRDALRKSKLYIPFFADRSKDIADTKTRRDTLAREIEELEKKINSSEDNGIKQLYASGNESLKNLYDEASAEDMIQDLKDSSDYESANIKPLEDKLREIASNWKEQQKILAEQEATRLLNSADLAEQARIAGLNEEISGLRSDSDKASGLEDEYRDKQNQLEASRKRQNTALAATGGGAGLIVLLSALNKLRKRKKKEISPEEYLNYLEEEGMA